MTDLEKLWERLRMINRDAQDGIETNSTQFILLLEEGANEDEIEKCCIEYERLEERQMTVVEIMEIVEGMMDDDKI